MDTWIANSDLLVGNDRSTIRINPATGNWSTPDVTLYSTAWHGLVEWKTDSDSMGSDHLPITIEVNCSKATIKRKSKKYSYKKANWIQYQDLISQKLDRSKIPRTCKAKLKTLTRTVTEAAKASIPMGHSKNRVPWWTPEVQEAVNKREEAKETAHLSEEHRQRWIQQNADTKRIINNAKTNSWREYCTQLSMSTDASAVWNTIKAMDGRGYVESSCAAITRNDKTLTSGKQKAKAFIKEYAAVSNVKSGKEDRSFARKTRSLVRKKCPCDSGACVPFDMKELDQAIDSIKLTCAPGPDATSNQMIAHLPPAGRQALLDIFNQALREGFCPSDWRRAIIIPILKKQKPASSISSYRPISLTSCVGKLFEKLLKNRISHWLESNNKISSAQAGFCSLRSAEDQIMRITQAVHDGFQQRKPPSRTLLALIDFSRAFDKVWHIGLLSKLLKLEMPLCWIQWIDAFLQDRVACVDFENSRSPYHHMHSGVPQGSILSPTLFLIFIDDIVESLPPSIECSLFSDDLALWTSSPSVDDVTRHLQAGLDAITQWSLRWKMTLSTEKSEVTLFTSDSRQANLQPRLMINNTPLPFNPNPTFLGVVLDRTLSFCSHVSHTKTKMKRRNLTLKALSGTSWGCNKEDLKNLFRAYSLSCALYSAAAWMPSASPTTLQQLQVCVNEGARTITGCCKGSPQDLTLLEADLTPLRTHSTIAAATAHERARRLPENNPLSHIVTQQVRRRVRKRAWREVGLAAAMEAQVANLPSMPLLAISPLAPWTATTLATLQLTSFNLTLIEPATKTDPPDKLRDITERTIERLPHPNFTLWTDGSAAEGVQNGGAGVIICQGAREVATISEAAGAATSSYNAELQAILAGLKWIANLPAPIY